MKRLLLLLVALLLVAGCGDDRNEEEVARVGNNSIEIADFQAYLDAATGEPWQAVDQRVGTRLLDQFLDQEVIAAGAEQQTSDEIPTDPAARSGFIRGLVESACGPAAPILQSVVEDEIERRMGEATPIRAHVRQMMLDGEEAALTVRKRLTDGEDWLTVSREVSLAPNADRGGEIGILQEGGLPPELDEVIFGLAAEEISPPVQGPSGFHIFQVLEVLPVGSPDRVGIEWTVRTEFEQTQARKHLRDCVDRLAFEVGVTVHADRLWFSYDGRYAGEKYATQ